MTDNVRNLQLMVNARCDEVEIQANLEMIKFKLIEDEIVDGSWVYESVMCGDQVNGCRFNEEDF